MPNFYLKELRICLISIRFVLETTIIGKRTTDMPNFYQKRLGKRTKDMTNLYQIYIINDYYREKKYGYA